jgi:triosephosphate isomerase
MTTTRRPLIAGNWKMNGLLSSLPALADIASGAAGLAGTVDVMVCPPATLITPFAAAAGGVMAIGGQNCHAEPSGAFTGDISAEMLADAGATAVILGHSERRALCFEDDAAVRRKVQAAWRARLLAIVCVGETAGARAAGGTLVVIGSQLTGSVPDGASAENLVVAYEPVWAIGTGQTPSPADVAEVHGFIRSQLTARFGGTAAGTRILYGGSVKASNAGELMAVADVDGALVGGASLNPKEFLAIAGVYGAA